MPSFDAFWQQGEHRLPLAARPVVMLEDFRTDPSVHPLRTPSGRIELHSQRIASFGYDDCPGHPVWQAPVEWLGGAAAEAFPLHLISDQPHTKLPSQLDFSSYSLGDKVDGREPVVIHPDDARSRGIAHVDVVRLFNARGACLASARISDAVMPGVLRTATGAWWDPVEAGNPDTLEKYGKRNVLAQDVGASKLSQGCAAQSCLVQVERFVGVVPPVTAFELPTFEAM